LGLFLAFFAGRLSSLSFYDRFATHTHTGVVNTHIAYISRWWHFHPTMNDSVPTEVSHKKNKSDMTESKSKNSATVHEDRETSWDAAAFDEKVRKDGKWKGSKEKKATRVQDISMSLVSGHEPQHSANDKNKESWPFDSSPCRMFGGKNTKGDGSNAPVNTELFKTEFGEIQADSKTESEESLEYNDSN
jgi:hypothetical protein